MYNMNLDYKAKTSGVNAYYQQKLLVFGISYKDFTGNNQTRGPAFITRVQIAKALNKSNVASKFSTAFQNILKVG